MPGGTEPWSKDHDNLMCKGILELLFLNRSYLYNLDGIRDVVDGHGNDRTSKKVDQFAAKIATLLGLTSEEVKAAKDKAKGGKRGGKKRTSGSPDTATPKKARTSAPPTPRTPRSGRKEISSKEENSEDEDNQDVSA